MPVDHLDKETSFSVQVTDSGINAGAKSRFVAAVDRLAGNFADIANAHLEAHSEVRRAKTKGEVALIDLLAKKAAEHLNVNPDMSARAIGKHFKNVIARQENSDEVLRSALEDLVDDVNSDALPESDAPLSEDFLSRFERYSENASTGELRQRWGRILAAEVRKPGTFSGKVLRLVDELDRDTALMFQSVCENRIGGILPISLTGRLPFGTLSKLITEDLIVDPGSNIKYIEYSIISDLSGIEMYQVYFPEMSVTFPIHVDLDSMNFVDDILIKNGDVLGIPSYILTDAGASIASILPHDQRGVLKKYAEKLKSAIPTPWVRLYKSQEDRMVIEEVVT